MSCAVHKCRQLSTQMHAHLAFSVTEAARALRVGNATVRGLIARGELPAFRVGPQRGTRVSLRALEGFIAERTFNDPCVDTCGHSEKQQNTPQI
jgi:excisionase family DNA binding protein